MSDQPQIAVVGAGGHAKVVVATLLDAGADVAAIFDRDRDRWGATLLGIPIVGPEEEIAARGLGHGLLAVGDNHARRKLAERLDLHWHTVVHPAAYVHPSARLGAGTVVFAGAAIQPEARIGDHTIVNTGATVDHDCEIGDFVHLAPGAHVAGGVTVGDGVLLGVGSAVIPSISIGAATVVGAGATVVRDLPPGVTARGVPARGIDDR